MAKVKKARTPVQVLKQRIRKVVAERKEIQAVFDRQWAADMRGIKAWQKKNPGKELVWPDRAYFVEWLLTQRSAALAMVAKLQRRLAKR